MKRIQNAPLQLFFLLLLLFSFTAMACQLGSALEATPTPRAREEEPEAEPEPTEEPPTVAAPTPEPEEPEVEEPIVPEEVIAPIERLQAATVQIFAKQVTTAVSKPSGPAPAPFFRPMASFSPMPTLPHLAHQVWPPSTTTRNCSSAKSQTSW